MPPVLQEIDIAVNILLGLTVLVIGLKEGVPLFSRERDGKFWQGLVVKHQSVSHFCMDAVVRDLLRNHILPAGNGKGRRQSQTECKESIAH